MNATPFTPNFVGSLGRYPFFDYVDSKSNLNFQYSSNINFNFSNNSNSTLSNLSNVYYNFNSNNVITGSNVSNIYYNTGFIDSNLLWWRYELMGTQAELVVQKANQTILSAQQTLMSATLSANSFTLATHTGQLNTLEPKVANLENNTFSKDQTSNIFVSSNVLSNTSNILANYNNLYNIPNELKNISNIFVSSNHLSNVLSNTSNTLANYNNLTNRPWITSGNNIYNNNTGNIGIGNVNPNYKLSVNGGGEFISPNGNKLIFSYDVNAYKHRISTTHNANTDTGNHIDFFTWRAGQGVNDDGDRHCLRLSATHTYFPSSTNKYFWINNRTIDYGNNDYTSTPLCIFNQTPSSATVLNDPQRVLALARQGTVNQNFGQTATFKLSRWENNDLNSRTRLDIDLSDSVNTDVNVMTLRSDGNIGINKTTPLYKLDVNGTINGTNMSIGTENIADNLQIKKLAITRTITYPYTWYSPSESMFIVGTYLDVYSDFNNYNSNDYINLNTGVYGESKLRLQGDGLTTLTGDTKLTLSSSNNIILSVSQGKNINLEGNVVFKNGIVVKKSPKYFTTSRTANFDGISCLAYDLDISTLTNYETIDSINFRHFRIKVFFASGQMSFQRTPRSFDISMSNYNSLSISCVESDGYFSELDRASNSNYFLYKQDFNKITACFPVSLFGSTNIKIAYILEDLLGK